MIRSTIIISSPQFHGHMAPLGYLYVAAALKAAGVVVRVLTPVSGSWADAEIRADLACFRPDLVIAGTSYKFHNNCPSSTVRGALRAAQVTKQVLPDATTLLIGPLNAVLYERLLNSDSVDAVVLGEPEIPCVAVARAIGDKRSIGEVDGLALKRGTEIHRTGPTPFPDPDMLPFPDRDAVGAEQLIHDTYFAARTTEVLSSRGCPFSCTYCFGARTSRRNECNTGAAFRGVSVPRVLEEIRVLHERYGVRGIKFADVEFGASRKRVAAICDGLLSEGLTDLRWRAVTRARSLDLELLKLMRRAGCVSIYYGVESGDDRMLKAMNKGVTCAQIREVFRWTCETGIHPEASFLLGVPGETEESIRKTIDFALEIDPMLATFHVFVPFPGIPLEGSLGLRGDIALDDWDVYQLRGNTSYCAVSAERLETLTGWAYRRFYLRPRVVVRTARQLAEPSMRRYLLGLAAGAAEGRWLRRVLLGR